jgi:hypothetical protein
MKLILSFRGLKKNDNKVKFKSGNITNLSFYIEILLV